MFHPCWFRGSRQQEADDLTSVSAGRSCKSVCGRRALARPLVGVRTKTIARGDAIVVQRQRADTRSPPGRNWEWQAIDRGDHARGDRRGSWRSGSAWPRPPVSVVLLREYERRVVFRLGRMIDAQGSGPGACPARVDRMVRVSLRPVTLDVPPQDVITRDNVPREGRRRRLLPSSTRMRRRPGRELPRATSQSPDDAALGARPGRTRHAPLRAREAQRGAAADHRRADRAVGHQGHHRRDQGRRDPAAMQRAMAARPRPSASGARRSSTPRASSRPRSASRDAADVIAANPRRSSCATCRR